MRKTILLWAASLSLWSSGCGDSSLANGNFSAANGSPNATPQSLAGRYQGVDHEEKATLELVVDPNGQASGSYQLRQASADLPAGVYPISGLIQPGSGFYTLAIGSKSGVVIQGELPQGPTEARTFHVTGAAEPIVGTLTAAAVGDVPPPNLEGTVTGLTFDRQNSNVEPLKNPKVFGFYVTPSRPGPPQTLLLHLAEKEGRGSRDLFFQLVSQGTPLEARRYEVTPISIATTQGVDVSFSDATPDHYRIYSTQSPPTVGHFTITNLTTTQMQATFQVDDIKAKEIGTGARGSFSVRGNLQLTIKGSISP